MPRAKKKRTSKPSPAAQAGQSTTTALSHRISPMEHRPDHVIEARYVRPAQLFLRFADGVEGTWTFDQLALDLSNMKLTTVKVSSSGNAVEVKSKWGDDVQLDSSSLRTLVDPGYAAAIERKLDFLASRIGL